MYKEKKRMGRGAAAAAANTRDGLIDWLFGTLLLTSGMRTRTRTTLSLSGGSGRSLFGGGPGFCLCFFWFWFRSRGPRGPHIMHLSVSISIPVVALGGTFDHLHAGHKILLSMSAWIASARLIVGITGQPAPLPPRLPAR